MVMPVNPRRMVRQAHKRVSAPSARLTRFPFRCYDDCGALRRSKGAQHSILFDENALPPKKYEMMMMKKMLACLMALCLLSPAASLAGETDGSFQYVLDKGTLVVGFVEDRSPMAYADADGNPVGFDVDVAYAVCDILGVELIAQNVQWDAAPAALSAKQVDCVWGGLAMTGENTEAFHFSLPYVDNQQVLVVRADSTYQALADFAGLTLGLQAASAAALDVAEAFKATLGNITEYETHTALLAALVEGSVDAALLDLTVAGHYMAAEHVEFRIVEEALASEMYGIGFGKEDIALADAVNAALIDLAFNGVLEEISTDWFTEDITIIAEVIAMAEEN